MHRQLTRNNAYVYADLVEVETHQIEVVGSEYTYVYQSIGIGITEKYENKAFIKQSTYVDAQNVRY